MGRVNPCRGCVERFPGVCHSMCKLYIEWKAIKEAKRKETYIDKHTEYEVRGLQIEGVNKAFKKKRR